MRLDTVLKRYFTAVVCLLIAVAAYFQAYGMGQLVASSAALDPSALPSSYPQRLRATPAAAASSDHTTEASDILGRNPFDSITGPISPDGGLGTSYFRPCQRRKTASTGTKIPPATRQRSCSSRPPTIRNGPLPTSLAPMERRSYAARGTT